MRAKGEPFPRGGNTFQGILKTSPHEGLALAGLGYVRMKNQDFPGALASFEAAKCT